MPAVKQEARFYQLPGAKLQVATGSMQTTELLERNTTYSRIRQQDHNRNKPSTLNAHISLQSSRQKAVPPCSQPSLTPVVPVRPLFLAVV